MVVIKPVYGCMLEAVCKHSIASTFKDQYSSLVKYSIIGHLRELSNPDLFLRLTGFKTAEAYMAITVI